VELRSAAGKCVDGCRGSWSCHICLLVVSAAGDMCTACFLHDICFCFTILVASCVGLMIFIHLHSQIYGMCRVGCAVQLFRVKTPGMHRITRPNVSMSHCLHSASSSTDSSQLTAAPTLGVPASGTTSGAYSAAQWSDERRPSCAELVAAARPPCASLTCPALSQQPHAS